MMMTKQTRWACTLAILTGFALRGCAASRSARTQPNILFIFADDHAWYEKRWMYEESLRAPLLVCWPGAVKPGTVNEDLVQNVDFAPTMLELAGVTPPPEMQGRSLVPLLVGRTPRDWRTTAYYHYYEHPGEHNVPRHYGIRTQRYKLIHYYQLGEWELFDLQNDPKELHSIVADPAYAAILQDMQAQLTELRRELGDHEGGE